MDAEKLFKRYRDLECYVQWTDADAERVRSVAEVLEPNFAALIDDFYFEIQRHDEAARVITGGPRQVEQLKNSLRAWLRELVSGQYDSQYVWRRWQVGLRHVEIGLSQTYASAAFSKLRKGLVDVLLAEWRGRAEQARHAIGSLHKRLDLDWMVIEDAYESERLHQAQSAERERGEDRFRRLVENAACMVVILRPDLSIAYFSPYAEDLTGYAAGAVVGKNYLDLFLGEEDQSPLAAEIVEVLAGKQTRDYESRVCCRNGSQRWLLWNAQRIDQYDGDVAVLAVGHDITERRQTEEQLLRSERLSGIGQMITGIAHESRNALQRIQSCGEMLELEVADNDSAAKLVRRLQQAQDDLRRLFDEVRNYAAPISIERSPCDISGVWREAWQLLEPSRRGRQADLTVETNSVDLRIAIDRFRIVQLFRNLMENSLAACADPVEIGIVCESAQLAGEPALRIRVRDNGPGLTPEARLNVFEPFFTTKTKGTGLGMAIARRIVEAHGGVLEVDAAVSPGAAFLITLPRSI